MAIRSSIYSDVDIELTKATDGDITKDTEVDAVINSLNNIVATMQGSRRMIPEFAQDLWNMLFEPLDEDTAYGIGERLLEAIQIWDDRVEVTGIDITPRYDENIYALSLSFRIKPILEEQTIDFILFAQ
jgi:phage baseplate assembly protein W